MDETPKAKAPMTKDEAMLACVQEIVAVLCHQGRTVGVGARGLFARDGQKTT